MAAASVARAEAAAASRARRAASSRAAASRRAASARAMESARAWAAARARASAALLSGAWRRGRRRSGGLVAGGDRERGDDEGRGAEGSTRHVFLLVDRVVVPTLTGGGRATRRRVLEEHRDWRWREAERVDERAESTGERARVAIGERLDGAQQLGRGRDGRVASRRRPFGVIEMIATRPSSGDRRLAASPARTRRATTIETVLCWVRASAARSFTEREAARPVAAGGRAGRW